VLFDSEQTLVLAYIDPASGSLALQALIGGLLSLAFTAKLFWRRIKARLTGKREE
jgi:hypothetical protein